MLRAHWKKPTDVLRAYANASIVGPDRVVFNIKGDDYRLVVAVNYRHQIVFIKWLGTDAFPSNWSYVHVVLPSSALTPGALGSSSLEKACENPPHSLGSFGERESKENNLRAGSVRALDGARPARFFEGGWLKAARYRKRDGRELGDHGCVSANRERLESRVTTKDPYPNSLFRLSAVPCGARDGEPLVPEQQDVLGVRSDQGRPAIVRTGVDCECGAVHDREINAAKNLCCYAVDRQVAPESTPVERKALALFLRAA